MKLFLKILTAVTILVISILMGLVISSIIMQDKVAGMILKSLNREISTKFEFESVRLSFIRQFPNASLVLSKVVVHSSPGFDSPSFGDNNTDTLLVARSVVAEFNIKGIIKGIYNIQQVTIKDGKINLYTDSKGEVSYRISGAARGGEKSAGGFTLSLERVDISNLEACYHDLFRKITSRAVIENARVKTKISGEKIDLDARGTIMSDLLKIDNFTISKRVEVRLDLNLTGSEKYMIFNKSSLEIDNNRLFISGLIGRDNTIDLSFNGNKLDLSGIWSFLGGDYKYLEKVTKYKPMGSATVEGKIKRPGGPAVNPRVDIGLILSDGRLGHPESGLGVNDLSFRAVYSNGPLAIPATSSLKVTDIEASLGSGNFSGSLLLAGFDSLKGDLKLKGRLVARELKEFLDLDKITSAEGSFDFDIEAGGYIGNREKFSPGDISRFKTVLNLDLQSFGISIRDNPYRLDDATGKIAIVDSVTSANLKFRFNDRNFYVNGKFINLVERLSRTRSALSALADIECDDFDVSLFSNTHASSGKSAKRNKSYSLPGNLLLDLNIKAGTFSFGSFKARDVTGKLSYKPGVLNFKTMKFNSLNGFISGNGFIIQDNTGSFISRGNLNLEKIDIRNTFLAFNNFRQDFIKAENLEGKLTGTLSFNLPLDSMLSPNMKALSAGGKYLITEGALINFEPVRALSKYIELEELENIRFDKLENDLFIRNNSIEIPQMEIKSSAADLSIQGIHGFDNDYEYHVKIFLSLILSRRMKKPKSNSTEFGVISDDGLGRTSLLLKIVNNGDKAKVSYDIKAIGNQIKNDVREEKKTLKTILNSEYGWFKSDSTVTRKEEQPRKPRVRISWGESDTADRDSDN
jgi:hypothetical protein